MSQLRWIDRQNPRLWACCLPSMYTLEELSSELDSVTLALGQLPGIQRLAVLTDLTDVRACDPLHRHRAGVFVRDQAALLKRHVVAWGFVSPRAALHGAITAIGWIGGFPMDTSIFSHRYDCVSWLEQQLLLDDLALKRTSGGKTVDG